MDCVRWKLYFDYFYLSILAKFFSLGIFSFARLGENGYCMLRGERESGLLVSYSMFTGESESGFRAPFIILTGDRLSGLLESLTSMAE